MEYMTQEQYKLYHQGLRDQGYSCTETKACFSDTEGAKKLWGSENFGCHKELLDSEVRKFLGGLTNGR